MKIVRSALAALAIVGVVTVSVSCGGLATIEADDLCLSWPDGGPPHAEDAVPAGLACDVVTRAKDASVEPPASFAPTLEYVCIERAGECPAPKDAYHQFAPCIEWQRGEGCGCVICGLCTSHRVWSVCGADPAASGACCYYAWTIETSILS